MRNLNVQMLNQCQESEMSMFHFTTNRLNFVLLLSLLLLLLPTTQSRFVKYGLVTICSPNVKAHDARMTGNTNVIIMPVLWIVDCFS